MKVIYKYRLPFMEVAKVHLPVGAEIIRIDGETDPINGGQISLWAIVDNKAPLIQDSP